MAKSDKKTIHKVFVLLGIAVTVVLLVLGILGWVAYSFATTSVKTELAAQKIYFPAAGSAAITALPAEDQVQMNKYAGQQLLTGAQAKVYADNFIAYHLTKVAGGQTYSQVSAAAMANPGSVKLKQEEQTLFQGETLRGLLLGDGYAYWTFGQIALYASIAAFAAAAVVLVLVMFGLRNIVQTK